MHIFWSGFLLGLGLAVFFYWAAIFWRARMLPGSSFCAHTPRVLFPDPSEEVTRIVPAPQALSEEGDDPSLAPVEKTTKIRMDEMQILLRRALTARREEEPSRKEG